MDPAITIIIPIFNVGEYLDLCLKSVAEQSFSNWECLLIDDGSTDKSREICDSWSERDSRFIVLHKMNEGVSVARNLGIEEANGELITFIDGDDWIGEHYLRTLYEGMESTDTDMVVSGITHVEENGMQIVFSSDIPLVLDLTDSSTKMVDSFMSNIGSFYGPTSILYRRRLIVDNCIRFPSDRSLGEDVVFNFSYLGYVKTVLICPESHYYYRRHSSSLISADYSSRFTIHYSNWLFQKSFLIGRSYWNEEVQKHFAAKLWGIVYEGLFMSKDRSIRKIKEILSIKEIELLKKYQDSFVASSWIKDIVLQRNLFLVWAVVNMLKIIR